MSEPAAASSTIGDGNNNNNIIHVAILPYPAAGHTRPAIQLAKKLLSHGVRLTMVNIFESLEDEQLAALRALNLPVVNLGVRPATTRVVGLPYFDHIESLEGELETVVGNLLGAAPALTCIISDIFLGCTQASPNSEYLVFFFWHHPAFWIILAYSSSPSAAGTSFHLRLMMEEIEEFE